MPLLIVKLTPRNLKRQYYTSGISKKKKLIICTVLALNQKLIQERKKHTTSHPRHLYLLTHHVLALFVVVETEDLLSFDSTIHVNKSTSLLALVNKLSHAHFTAGPGHTNPPSVNST